VFNAYSGACRIFNLHYLLGGAPTLYEDGQAIRDYVNITTSSTPMCSCSRSNVPSAAYSNVGGGTPYTTAEFSDVVRRH